jgi:hypothetical protein
MTGPADPTEDRAVDAPTRLQLIARRGCAGLAYAIVLAPVVAVIWFFSSIPQGWQQFGDLMVKIFWEGPPGAHTQITIVNESGHDVQIDLMQFGDTPVAFSRPLESYREGDDRQKSIHYQAIYFQDIKPFDIPVRVRYRELDTGREHRAGFLVDRRPRERCRFVVSLEPDGPRVSECLRSELDDFDSP